MYKMNKQTQQEVLREWGKISEIDNNLLYNSWVFDELQKLGRMCKKHQWIAVDLCNGDIEDTSLLEKQETKIKDFLEGFNMWFNSHYKIKPLRVEFQGDPRGNTAKITFSTDEENSHFVLWYSLGRKD